MEKLIAELKKQQPDFYDQSELDKRINSQQTTI